MFQYLCGLTRGCVEMDKEGKIIIVVFVVIILLGVLGRLLLGV